MPESGEVFYIIPHTHWEGAVFQTREAYLERGLPNILRALRLLREYPEYRFALDQADYVRGFLGRYPEEAGSFREAVAEGRLALVGGTEVMLDVNMPSGESLVRQVLLGKGYFRRELGVEVTAGWALDTFGHHAQMPQLLRLAGFSSYWFMRGVPNWETPGEFQWEGLDGTRVPAFWLAHTYGVMHGSPRTAGEFAAWVEGRWQLLAPFAGGPERVGLEGADVSEPEEWVPERVAQYNATEGRPFRVQLGTPGDYEAAVAKRGELPVVSGELNPIFQGTYSSRIELKQATRELETILTDAEKLGAMLRALGAEVEDGEVERAWRPMLFNQAHDLMSGVMTDRVYEDTLRKYDYSRQVGEELREARRRALVARVDTRGEGVPVVVVNTLGRRRTDVATVTVGFSEAGVRGVQVRGPEGETVAGQILEAVRSETGDLLQAEVAFVARDLPALGYAVYRVLPTAEEAQDDSADRLENEFYRVEMDATGAMRGVWVKEGGWEALRGAGNVVARQEDQGDFWELYKTLDGAMRIAASERHLPPGPGEALLSTEEAGEPGTIRRGPVVWEYSVAHPYGSGRIETRVRLYAGVRRIEVRTKLLNNETAVRYRVLFPTSIREGRVTHEIPFGASERPDGVEFPAQNWVDVSDGERGVALLNRGLPGNNVADGTIMLSLLRSTRIVSYGYQGGYEPGAGSDSGLELGKELTFDYALLPHAGDWREARVWEEGEALNHPLLVHSAAAQEGELRPQWGLLEVTPGNVVVSAVKVGSEGRIVARVYEATGAATEAALVWAGEVAEAEELDLLERPVGRVESEGRAMKVALRGWEVKTVGVGRGIDD